MAAAAAPSIDSTTQANTDVWQTTLASNLGTATSGQVVDVTQAAAVSSSAVVGSGGAGAGADHGHG